MTIITAEFRRFGALGKATARHLVLIGEDADDVARSLLGAAWQAFAVKGMGVHPSNMRPISLHDGRRQLIANPQADPGFRKLTK